MTISSRTIPWRLRQEILEDMVVLNIVHFSDKPTVEKVVDKARRYYGYERRQVLHALRELADYRIIFTSSPIPCQAEDPVVEGARA